jgi:tetratricopeptide (TPR) repeat protein
LVASLTVPGFAASGDDFKLALVDHQGQLRWSAEGFKVIESSAKPNGQEIGIRGKDGSGRLTFLGFLFLFPEQAPLSSAKCRDGVLNPEKKSNATLKVLGTSEIMQPGSLPVSLVSYSTQGRNGKLAYMVRGFVATGDICGDLEFYSDRPISAGDADLKKTFTSYQFVENYAPGFNDAFVYAQILYKAHLYKAAAPIFETALGRLKQAPGVDVSTTKRVMTDQAGMAYGLSGNIKKARTIFENGIAEDPGYPMYYYNLACADAEEKNLDAARKHLREAFDRKTNVLQGESMPDPTTDESFLPFRGNKDFWTFLEGLRSND